MNNSPEPSPEQAQMAADAVRLMKELEQLLVSVQQHAPILDKPWLRVAREKIHNGLDLLVLGLSGAADSIRIAQTQ